MFAVLGRRTARITTSLSPHTTSILVRAAASRGLVNMSLPHRLMHKDDTGDLRAGMASAGASEPVESAVTPQMTEGMGKRMEKTVEMGTKGRRLIVGCDGTWVNSDEDPSIPSNVTRICRSLRSSPRPSSSTPQSGAASKTQIIYYHRGIGTDGGIESKFIGGGTGNELSEHARECYGFLCNNWKEGDEIFLFGFSRGAYTVRAISALISDVGLLTTIGMEWFYEIFDDWKNQNIPGKAATGPVDHGLFKGMTHRPKMPSNEYRNELEKRGYTTRDVPIRVVGVWDTVGALGIPPILGLNVSETEVLQYSFVNTKVSQCITHAFQALGLDDHRAAFSPAVWEDPDKPNNLKTLRQCWFPGVHCNIGGAGGYQDQGLANVTLAWMVSQIQSIPNADGTTGALDFDEEYLNWVFNQNITHVRSVDPKGGFRGWGLGKIEETMTAAYSIVGQHKTWASSKGLMDWLKPGDVSRTPGTYEEIDASTGRGLKTGHLLKNTNEKIHPSVRIRVTNGGKGVINDGKEPATYVPRGLDGWKLLGAGNAKDPLAEGFAWKSQDSRTLLVEEKLSPFEKTLLGVSDQAIALGGGK